MKKDDLMGQDIKEFLASEDLTIKEAMRQMDKVGQKILFIVDKEDRFLGSVTDGDIRRWVLGEGSLMASVEKIYNRHAVSVGEDYQVKHIKKIMLEKNIAWIPVIDKKGMVREVLLWADIFGDGAVFPKREIDIPVVIMAGGKGTRLDPFTRILPKPLIPVGEKAIIEIIMDKFAAFGIREFYVSINHKSKMIKAYFDEVNIDYKLKFIEEDQPMGTAGSLKFLQRKLKGDVFISNCDIIIESDYYEIVDFHRSKKYDLTIVGSFRHFTIPYGICTIENGGQLQNLEEKPEYDYLVNTGMYVLNAKMLKLIPKRRHIDVTDLIERIQEAGGSIGVFPVDEKSWIDVGQWEEYRKSVRNLQIGDTTG